MTLIQEEFLTQCPAWARKLGVPRLALWNWILDLMPLGWPDRYDAIRVKSVSLFTEEEKRVAKKVLIAWEEMATRP